MLSCVYIGANGGVAYSDPRGAEGMASTKLDTTGMDRHESLLSSSVEGMRSRFERPLQKDYHPHSVAVKAVAKGVVVFLLGPNNSIQFGKEGIPPFFSFFALCWPQHGFSTACE